MSYLIESPSPTERKLVFTIEAKAVNSSIEATLRDYAKNLDIKGFRKGKVPHSLIEQRYNSEVYGHTTDTLVSEHINLALEAENFHPVSRVKLVDEENIKHIVRDTDFTFECTFEVLPTFDIPEDFTNLSINVETPELTEEETETVIKQLRQSMATLEDVTENRKPELDDVLLVDVEGTADGEIVPGMAAQNFHMQLREENKDKEVDTLVRTLNAGEEGTGTMLCPSDFPEPSFRGRTIEIKVKLHKIQKQILPEFNDEFAKNIGFDGLEKLEQAISFQAMDNKMTRVKNKAQEELIKELIKDLDFPLPESMLHASISNYMAEARHHLAQKNMSQEGMIEALAEMKTKGEEVAKKDTKAHVFLLSLAYREKFVANNHEIDAYIRQLALESKQDFEQVRHHITQAGMIREIQERILAGKALDYVYNKAQKTVVDADGKPIPTPEAKTEENSN